MFLAHPAFEHNYVAGPAERSSQPIQMIGAVRQDQRRTASAQRRETLFLTIPISWRGTLQQYVGRLHRIHHGKAVVRVYDYVDILLPMLVRMYNRRLKGYRAIAYELGSIDPRRPDLL